MAGQTPNYKLVKPAPEEFYDVAVPNGNMDIIDALIKALQDGKANSTDLTSVTNAVTQHLDEIMPHRFVDNGKTYRWGFRTVDGEPEFIYEEVV